MRGSALAETAITLSFTLLCIFGGMQIALLGYYQVQLDGSAFFYAHGFAIGQTTAGLSASNLPAVFPNVQTSLLSPAYASPPNTSVDPNFTQWGALTNRYGGAAIIRPQRVEVSTQMTTSQLSVLGNSVTLSGGNIDSRSMVGNHDDDAQGASPNSATIWNSLVDPLKTDDQNVPPYYFNLAFMWYCNTFDYAGGTCPSRSLHAVGLASYLKADNYNASQNGVVTNVVFQTMACHQRIFVDLVNLLPAQRWHKNASGQTSPQDYVGTQWDETATGPASVPAANGASFQLVYSWDINQIYGESWANAGQVYPLHPGNGCTAGGPGA
ncbi:MAG: hypothetical protein JO092_04315 [Candidatus Eremiobacteraeota bacterium]|nr:hypothetical protein [Candidatus Eremiobacteraeota bacterium]